MGSCNFTWCDGEAHDENYHRGVIASHEGGNVKLEASIDIDTGEATAFFAIDWWDIALEDIEVEIASLGAMTANFASALRAFSDNETVRSLAGSHHEAERQ